MAFLFEPRNQTGGGNDHKGQPLLIKSNLDLSM